MCEYYDDFDDDVELEEDESLSNRTASYRRQKKKDKDIKRRNIINYYGYAPHVGYICETHIKYFGRSNCQRWIKRLTSKRARKTNLVNGNSYRKVFDYWWTLY